jgi:hypothetical protein
MDMHMLAQVIFPVGSEFVDEAVAAAQANYTLAFDLSTGSFVQLTGSLAMSHFHEGGIQLSGPGGVLFSEFTDATPNLQLFLQPGHYSLSFFQTAVTVDAIFASCSPLSPTCSFQRFANLSLDVALVPEPRWTAIVPAILFVACCLAARKRAQRFLEEMPGASRGMSLHEPVPCDDSHAPSLVRYSHSRVNPSPIRTAEPRCALASLASTETPPSSE